jgi:hypothetical protein
MNKNEIEYVKHSFKEYLSKSDFVSASDIKSYLQSPKKYYYDKYEKKEKEEERYNYIGSAIHEMVLEPHQFFENFAISPKFDRRTKEGKENYLSFSNQNRGKIILFEDEMDIIKEVAENAMKNDTLTELLKDSYKELSCYTIDEKTGLKLKMRPDAFPKTKNTIVDLKSCQDSSPKSFKSNVYSFGYSISAAYYLDFLNRENYVFVALEKQAPYQVALYVLNDEMIEYGRQQYRMGLDLIKWSLDNNYYPSHNEFEVLKESYMLGNLENYFDDIKKSELITIL